MAKVLGFLKGKKAEISVRFESDTEREMKRVGESEVPIFVGSEDVSGRASVITKKSMSHLGIKAEFIGQIELSHARGKPVVFVQEVVDLAGEGSMEGSSVFDFAFEGVEKIHESYNGINARLRYFVRITVGQKYGDIVKESDIWVINYSSAPEDNRGIKMEVGISECLHIEIEYVSTKHNLQDVVIGKIYFLLSRIKVKHMAVSLVRRETVAVGKEHVSERRILSKYEIMDGEPVRGESIPVRIFLGAYPLTPTYHKVENKFSLRYYLSLGIIDAEDRRYFKQHEIVLWRRTEEADEDRRALGAFRSALSKTKS